MPGRSGTGRLAPRYAQWAARNNGLPSAQRAAQGPAGGVPFLPTVAGFTALYPNARLVVEWAPAANLALTDASWTWTDITTDVLLGSGEAINISPMGRSDAVNQAQPAGCTFKLDNRAGTYSRGPQSSSYPNVRLNIPVRVSISLDGSNTGKRTRFQGYSWSLQPEWDTTGDWAVVTVRAAGVMRRLQHGTLPSVSSLYREIVNDDSGYLRSYWPLEDVGGTTLLATGVTGGKRMYFEGASLGAYSQLPGSGSVLTFTSAGYLSGVVSGSFANRWQVDFLINIPSQRAADTTLMSVDMIGGTISRWDIVMQGSSPSNVVVNGYDNSSVLAQTQTLNTGAIGQMVNGPMSVRFMSRQTGGNVDWQLVIFDAEISTSGAVGTGTPFAGTVGSPRTVSTPRSANLDGVSMGHIVMWDVYDHVQDDDPYRGWTSERPSHRAERLCNENGLTYVGTDESFTNMGEQQEQSLIDLLRECEDVDFGFLFDGLSAGLHFRNSSLIVNRAPEMTIGVSELVPPIAPDDDDQNVVNRVTATRQGGSSATYEQVSGPLGTAAIDRYESSVSNINVPYDQSTEGYAAWLVHLGTVDGYRYPQISIDFRRNPARAADWLAVLPSHRIDVTGVSVWAVEHPSETVELRVNGWSESLSNMLWTATLNCSPYAPWNVPVLDDATSSFASQGTLVLDVADGASLVTTAASAGALALRVTDSSDASNTWSMTTPGGQTTNLVLSVGGRKVTATAVSDQVGYQEFTIAAPGLPADVAVGAVVKLWAPSTLGYG